MALKTYKTLPVHIVEDHNEVLPFIYGAMGSRHLPLYDNCLIHIDSHPDLLVPKEMPADAAWNKYKLFSYLSIENWILPGCYSSQFGSIYWVKPNWSSQIPLGHYKVHIGTVDNKIRVDSNLYYFLSDGLYESKHYLKNRKEFNLNVIEMSDSDLLEELSDFLKNKKFYILDIDLDFFSTRNPFLKMFQKGNLYDKLKSLYSFDLPENLLINSLNVDEVDQKELLKKVTMNRNQQLNELGLIFHHLNAKGTLSNFEKEFSTVRKSMIKDIVTCVNDFYGKDEVDWLMVHNAGLTCDATDLPHHVSTDEELSKLLRQFQIFLQTINIRPILITIARSTEDDYTPSTQVAHIQDRVLKILEKTYGELNVQKSYEKT